MSERITDAVKSKYGSIAEGELSSNHEGVKAIAQAFGYSEEEISSIPAEANMGLSCGNPTATASLKEGEVVVDLGCGGGLDVFLAAKKVGASGKAIGIDMTPSMLERARESAKKAEIANAEFHHATIDALPLEDNSVDCVISNCVINLAEDKPKVFREIFRVLKPGGRVAVSDIALKKELPAEFANDLMAYVGCISGAIFFHEYEQGLKDAGFPAVSISDNGSDLNAYTQVNDQPGCCNTAPLDAPSDSLPLASSGCCGGEPKDLSIHEGLAETFKKIDVNEYAASVRVYAVKPE